MRRYQKGIENIDMKLIEEARDVQHYLLTFDSSYPTKYEEVKKAYVHLFLPGKEDISRTLILLHGTGGRKLEHLYYFPYYFASNSIATAILILPYHYERTPKGHKSGDMIMDIDNAALKSRFMHGAMDVGALIRVLKDKGLSHFSIMGISFGGMISIMAMAMEKEIEKGILVVTGGNFEYITWKSVATKVLRIKYESSDSGCTAKRCHEIHKAFRGYLNGLKDLKDIDKVEKEQECFTYDPMTYAHFLKGRPILMFNAIFDMFIPRRATLELWEELGRPELHWLFSGHLSSILYKKKIARHTLTFLTR
ncbi:MAG: alpha/beta hydrolase family protein [Thermotogae bacterium]|nr:alpha/beta hydrolase family protein [Thermotogota bacterium]